KFDGKEVAEMRDLPRIVADTSVDEEVDVVVFRAGKEQTIQIKVGRLEDGEKSIKASVPAEPVEPAKPEPVLGMMLEGLNDENREASGVKSDVEGVYIAEVIEGSKAEDKGLKVGDVIVDINQESVKSLDDVNARIADLKKQGRKNALLMVQPKDGAIGFVVLQID
ncbi:MAG: PDZ domain-containing protein, partial [Nitratireductor sp.]